MLIAGRARRQFIWVGVLCVLVIGLIVQIGRRPRTQSADEFGLGGHRQAVSYAGTQACVPCHRTIAEQFQRSGMGRSWRTIESQAQPQFGESEPSHHPLSNLSYRTFQLDGRYYVQESRLETALNPEHQLTREIHFTIGSGKHAQA